MAAGGPLTGELDYSLIRLSNLGQLDVSFALPLPTLHAPPASAGAEHEAGPPAGLPSPAVLDRVAALLQAADVSYVCVPRRCACIAAQRARQARARGVQP